MPARLESLALSLDRIEREQSRRLSGIVQPALEAAGRLRRAFDVAGLPVEPALQRGDQLDRQQAVHQRGLRQGEHRRRPQHDRCR